MRPHPRPRVLPVLATGALVLPLLLAPVAAGTAGDDGCAIGELEVSRVEVRAQLTGDGEVAEVRRRQTRSTAAGETCADERDVDADALPVAVGVLHSDPVAGSIEPSELGEVDGPVTTRVAVRDLTAQERTFTVDAPGGEQRVERRVAVPHLVRLAITYPDGWSRVAPRGGDVRTDVVDGGVRIARSLVLFPPLTDTEVVLEVAAAPGRGVPDVAVEVTPITDDAAARLADDELGRDAAAVVAALTETGADGAEQLAEGTAGLADGLGELADGAGQLADGLGQAAAGGAPLREGAAQLAGGTAELADGTEQFAAGLRPLAAGAQELADGNRQLGEQLGVAAEGADQLADGNDQLADGTEQITAGFGQFTGGTDALRESIRSQLPDLGPITDAIVDAIAGPLEEVADGAGQLVEGLDQLAAGNRELAAGNRELADGLRQAAAGADQLGGGGAQLADGAAQASAAADELAAGSGELAAGAAQLSDGIDAYTRGVEEAAGAGGQLAAGADEAAAGAGELADGAAQLPEALRQATDTADRQNVRLTEQRAVVALGRELADDAVVAAAGAAPSRTLTIELAAAGDDPPNLVLWGAIAAVLLAGGVAGRTWWRSRREVAA